MDMWHMDENHYQLDITSQYGWKMIERMEMRKQISKTSWSIRASQQAFLGAMAPSKWDAEQEKQRDMLREHWLRCLGLEE